MLLMGGIAVLEDTVVVYPAPAGEPPSKDYIVEVNGKNVFVYSANVLHGGPASFASFDFSGSVTVKVVPQTKVKSVVVRPSSYGISPVVKEGTISFSLSRPMNVSVEINGSFERPLLLFANPIETDVPAKDDPNVLYFGPGVHEIGSTNVKSDTTVYIAGGAIVRGIIPPDEKPVQEKNWKGNKVYQDLFHIDKAKNVKIRGRGIIDGSALPWHARCPIRFTEATDFLVEGIVIRDSPSWCMPMFLSSDGKIVNVKAVCHRENSDGINIVNSRNIVVENCFLRNNDDEICVKTTQPSPAPGSSDITVRNCVVWNDRAYGIGITYETRAPIRGILFKECDIIHDHGIGALAIHVSDGATISNVRFEDIRVEDCRNRLIRLWIGKDMWGNDAERGHINDILFKNVSLVGTLPTRSEIVGADADHAVHNVAFENLSINGKTVENAKSAGIKLNQHAQEIRFAR